jgi:hypothetical protein
VNQGHKVVGLVILGQRKPSKESINIVTNDMLKVMQPQHKQLITKLKMEILEKAQ